MNRPAEIHRFVGTVYAIPTRQGAWAMKRITLRGCEHTESVLASEPTGRVRRCLGCEADALAASGVCLVCEERDREPEQSVCAGCAKALGFFGTATI